MYIYSCSPLRRIWKECILRVMKALTSPYTILILYYMLHILCFEMLLQMLIFFRVIFSIEYNCAWVSDDSFGDQFGVLQRSRTIPFVPWQRQPGNPWHWRYACPDVVQTIGQRMHWVRCVSLEPVVVPESVPIFSVRHRCCVQCEGKAHSCHVFGSLREHRIII